MAEREDAIFSLPWTHTERTKLWPNVDAVDVLCTPQNFGLRFTLSPTKKVTPWIAPVTQAQLIKKGTNGQRKVKKLQRPMRGAQKKMKMDSIPLEE